MPIREAGARLGRQEMRLACKHPRLAFEDVRLMRLGRALCTNW
jgi:hypothetical protein